LPDPAGKSLDPFYKRQLYGIVSCLCASDGHQLSWVKVVVIIFGLVVLFIVGQWTLGWLLVYGLYKFFSGTANDWTGLNPYLLKAVGWALALVVAYLTCARKAKFLRRWQVLGILPVLFNLGLYLLTKDLYFRFSDGTPLQWAAVSDYGVVFCAKPGFGPDGKPLLRVTAENIKRFKYLHDKLSVVDPEHVDWFSPNTREANIFYDKSPSGEFEFYNRWAHHPGNGQELKPVTAKVRSEYDAWKKERLERETSAKAEQAQLNEKKGADDARERHLRESRSLFRPIVTDSNKVNIALVVMCDSKSADCDQVAQKLLRGLQAAAPEIVFLPDYFTQDFIEKGYFEKPIKATPLSLKRSPGFLPLTICLFAR
jgi:hypothetical protein